MHDRRHPDTNDSAFNVVVYVEPGPPNPTIDEHARHMLEDHSVCGTSGGLGYVVLEKSDFDRLWAGVDNGDALGTACAILQLLGPEGEQFINLEQDFIYGWVEQEDEQHGRILLLQIIPRSQMRSAWNAVNN
jgi:hypothetical protein